MAAKLVLGVISDTHGLLRPEALEALRGSDLILHAGDVGSAGILDELRRIAPVNAVRGNIDSSPWCETLPQTEVIEAGGLSLYMLHNLKQLDLNPAAAGFAAVICGHSHAPMNEVRNGVLYFNPAGAGPRRFKLPICVGRLRIREGSISGEIIELQLSH
jgi:putative phosphoesterase